jgi:glycosyltransferase involved in cell wall biosynthesis
VNVLVATTFVPFLDGGAQILARDLAYALRVRGHDVHEVSIPTTSRWDRLLEETLAMRLLEVGRGSDVLLALRPPSYALRHADKRVWFIHHHRSAYDLWGTQWQDFPSTARGVATRDAVRRVDDLYLAEAQRICAASKTVADRLRRFNGIDADVLYPPLAHAAGLYWEQPEDYVVYPSRITSHKRQALAIDAAAHVATDVRVVIAGAPDHPGTLEALAAMVRERGLEQRVTIIGRWISEAEKAELIARSLAVLYVPYDEDFGYVSLEAAHAGKPIVTCTDSGGAGELVRPGESGLVAAPDGRALAEAIDGLRADPARATALGVRARELLAELHVDWDRVVDRLIS